MEIKNIGKTTVIRFNRFYKWFRKPLEYFFAFLQMKLLDNGFSLIHAGCVSKNNEGLLFPAFSDTGKTTTTLRFVESGYRLLGDDMVITDGDRIFSFPTSIKKISRRPFETLPLLRKIKFGKQILGGRGINVNTA